MKNKVSFAPFLDSWAAEALHKSKYFGFYIVISPIMFRIFIGIWKPKLPSDPDVDAWRWEVQKSWRSARAR